jgi:hypothetical protein
MHPQSASALMPNMDRRIRLGGGISGCHYSLWSPSRPQVVVARCHASSVWRSAGVRRIVREI